MASTGEVWKLGHRPALDGVRGIAVLLVVICHIPAIQWPAAGQVGVSTFFTLSGFLIASLLLEERQTSGRVNLRSFYLRRARRLMPALLACVGLVGVISWAASGLLASPREVLAALTYTTNFLTVTNGEPHGALAHTWSLAVEEQFYLVWPVLFALAAWRGVRRPVLIGVVGAGIVASLATRLANAGDFDRLVAGSDTRAGELLAGVLLALLMHRTSRAWPPMLAVIGVVGLLALTAVPELDLLTYGLLIAPVLTGMVLVGSVQAEPVKWLENRALLWLGRRSYGLYVWHFPVSFVVLLVFQLDPWYVQGAWMVPVSLLLAALSWRYVETPFRRRQVNGAAPLVTVSRETPTVLVVPPGLS